MTSEPRPPPLPGAAPWPGGAEPWPGGAEPSESSPEPPSPTSSRPPPSETSPSPSEDPPPLPHGGGGGATDPRYCDRELALFEEDLATRPRVPALLRRMAAYSALSPSSESQRLPGRALGTLRGVAAPSLQTLLGLVLVLRLPWVVGTGGVLQACAIALLLGACTMLTAVSLSAVATNSLDPGDCPLGLLTGALGSEAGGAVGVCAFLSAAFAAAAAALGAAEILLVYVAPQAAVLPGRGRGALLNNGRGYGAGLLGLLGLGAAHPPTARLAPLGPAGLLLALLGLQAGALRAALPGGAPHGLCLPAQGGGRLLPCPSPPGGGSNGSAGGGAAVEGPSVRRLAQNLWPRPPEPPPRGGRDDVSDDVAEDVDDSSFGVLLGLSLPSASGVLWGCSHAGALRDVTRSVPAGSLGAALASALAYLGAALLLGASVEGRLLRDKFGAALRGSPVAGAACWPLPAWLPLAGALLAGGGAGLQALLGGTRLLRGLARARALPLPQALGRGRCWALLVTAAVGELGVLVGSLDLLAPVLSVLLMTSYLGVNLACALRGWGGAPGWRPARCYHWAVSLAGAALCLALMLVTRWPHALLALGIGATAHQLLRHRRRCSDGGGEGLRALALSVTQQVLLRLEPGQPPAPARRPQLLVLVKVGEGRVAQPALVALGAELQGGAGLLVLGTCVPGHTPRERPRAEQALRAGLAGAGARGFVQVQVGGEGLGALAQGGGLGGLRPNTVLLGWPRPEPRAARRFLEVLHAVAEAGRALLVAKGPVGEGPARGPLDVWWVVGEGRLLTRLALQLLRHPAWRGCPLRLFTPALLRDNSPRLQRQLLELVRRRGLPAQVHVVELQDSAVSAYTYERTLMMEQRVQMLRQMRQGGHAPSQTPSAGEEEEEGGAGGAPRRGPSPGNVRRMHAAERLNRALGGRSGGARLVLLDLPPPPPPGAPRPRESYLEFLEVLTEGLGPVLLVRGGDGDPPTP